EYKVRRTFWYQVLIAVPGLPHGLFVEMELFDADPNVPIVVLLNAHPSHGKHMKPYPWKCHSCRQQALAPATIDYEAEIEHDGQVYVVRVPALEILRCSNCAEVVLDDAASRRVSDALRAAAGLLTPSEIQQSRESLGLDRAHLADYLGVPEPVAARWETGGQ